MYKNVRSLRRLAGLWLEVLSGVVLLSAIFSFVAAQDRSDHSAPPVPTLDLHKGDVIRFNSPGPTAVSSRIKCGPGGDMYAVYSSSSRELAPEPIRRVSPSSRSVTEYRVPTISGYDKLVRQSFSVGADARLYALFRASTSGSESKPADVYLVVKYKDDGQLDSFTRIGDMLGKSIRPSSLIVFTDGQFLISGTTSEKSADGTLLGVFSAIFDRSGVFRAPVSLMKPETPAATEPAGQPGVTSSTSKNKQSQSQKQNTSPVALASALHSFTSADGIVYVFQEDGRLDTISPAGSLDHEFLLKPPADGLTGIHMAPAGPGFLFVFYDHLATGEPDENLQSRGVIAVVFPQNDQITAMYRMPKAAETDFSVVGCAASPNDFLFLSSDDQGYLTIVHYVPN